MDWKSFILGASAGFIGGYAVKEAVAKKELLSSEKVLENVKKQFKKAGPINGSWIYMKPVPYKKDSLQFQAYQGGIAKAENGSNKQYEFFADARTGNLLEVNILNELKHLL